MLARYIQSRMKGSAVVQGFKSLAAAMHPQLPLTSKESNRLLNALTGSFRKHLDEVHPPKAAEDGKHISANGPCATSKPSQHAMHSSAALADKHLASVLTNPLLAKGQHAVKTPEQEYASAKFELQKNPAKDPITLLEDYQERGAATVAIAKLCLTVFKDSIESLPKAIQQKEILQTQPGRRTLLWLCENERFKEKAVADDRELLYALVTFLMKEGLEQYIWNLLHVDLSDDEQPSKRPASNSELKNKLESYRWKGRLLAHMVAYQVHGDDSKPNGLIDAMEMFHKAYAIRKNAKDFMRFLPLGQAYAVLSHALTSNRYDRKGMMLDAERYERYIEEMRTCNDTSWAAHDFSVAKHWLWHPTKPSADRMLSYYRNIQTNMAYSWRGAASDFKAPATTEKLLNFYFTLVQSIALLRAEGRERDAHWLISLARETYPDHAAKYLDKHLERQLRDSASLVGTKAAQEEADAPSTPERVPFPTFA